MSIQLFRLLKGRLGVTKLKIITECLRCFQPQKYRPYMLIEKFLIKAFHCDFSTLFIP